MVYTHVLKLGGGAVRSPLDALLGPPHGSATSAVVAEEPRPADRHLPVHFPCFRATPSSTARATSAS
jgi:hypothetical protein